MLFPEQGDDSGFDAVLVDFDASAEVHLHSSLYPTHDVIKGRVGERATPCGATHNPLVEPDKRISRHPALLKTSRLRHTQAVARLPAFTSPPAQIAGFAHRS